MEPKKRLKKHTLTEPKWVWGEHLLERINEISAEIHRNTLTGPANWVIMGSATAELLDEVLSDYNEPNLEIGDTRIDGDTYIQDITLIPNRSIERCELSVRISPTMYSGVTTMDGGP
jgi:hypothetical protein